LSEGLPGIRRILLALLTLAAIFLLSILSVHPPAVKHSSAPATDFSAERARAVLQNLLGDGSPHPVGSAADDAVRARILEELARIGYQPEVEEGFSCDEYGTCAYVKNVLARLNGSEAEAPAVLLAAHYDSVPAGPGASDDGIGVASVLEIARALKPAPQPRHSVIFLLDEGEEAGLLGARVFVNQHSWAKDVRAVVNIDNRGTSGPSLLFETGAANEWAVHLYAKYARHPATSSIFYAAYQQLPNDTDFTIFKAAGYEGVNFACIGDVSHYHTPLDNFANTRPGTIQHHGDNSLPMVLAFANSDSLTSLPHRDAVYFDVFQARTIWWPLAWTPWIAVAAAILIFFQAAWLIRTSRVRPVEIAWAMLGWLATLLLTGALAFLLRWVLRRAGNLPVNWVAHGVVVQTAFWLLAIFVVVYVALAFARRASFWGWWCGVWIWWAVLSLVIAWREPAMSFVLLLPACVAALAALPFTLRRTEQPAAGALVALLPLAASATLGFAALLLFYDALGGQVLTAISLLVALFLTPLCPLIPDLLGARPAWRLSFLGGVTSLLVLSIFGSAVIPAYSAKSPERLNIEYRLDADSGKSQWIVAPESGRLPEPIRVATQFDRADKGAFPWSSRVAFLADAPPLHMPPPTFTVLESSAAGEKRLFRTLLRSERGAPNALVLFPPDTDIQSVRMENEPMLPESPRARRYLNGWTLYECVTMPAKGVEISFTLPVGKAVEVSVLDRSFGLPDEGSFLLKSRPLTAIPSQNGDVTIVSRRVQLLP
jgi:Peptidase family M28